MRMGPWFLVIRSAYTAWFHTWLQCAELQHLNCAWDYSPALVPQVADGKKVQQIEIPHWGF